MKLKKKNYFKIQFKNILKYLIFLIVGNLCLFFFPLLIFLRRNNIYVINYHATYPQYEKNFKKQINFYKKYFEFISEKNILEKNFKYKNKPKLLISFDDGHISNFKTLKYLAENKIPAIIFIPFKFIFRKKEKNLVKENFITNKKYKIISNLSLDKKNNYRNLSLSKKMLKDLNFFFDIGCHGYNHIRLGENLNNKQLFKEIKISKLFLEKRLNIKVNSFCWIVGDYKSYSKRASDLIKQNYKLSFDTCCKPRSLDRHSFCLNRFNIENYFKLNQVAFILSGFYEIIYVKKRNFIQKKYFIN